MRLVRFVASDLTTYEFSKADAFDAYADGRSGAAMQDVQLGGYDTLGTNDSTDEPYQIVRRCTLIQDTPTLLESDIDNARAIRGKSGTMYATTYAGVVRWIPCRCSAVTLERTNRNFNVQPVTFVFDVGSPSWFGALSEDWTLDDTPQVYFDTGYNLDSTDFSKTMASSPSTLTVTNGGNRTIYDAVITITAGSANITAFTLENTTNALTNMTWTGTLTAGQAIVLDCGAFSILNNGADAYSGLVINSTHATPYWVEIEPGNNSIKLTFTGGSNDSTLSVALADGWA